MALPETELIHQYHNRHLLAFIAILNSMKLNERISFSFLKKQVEQTAGRDFGYIDSLLKYLKENEYQGNKLVSISDKSIKKISERPFILPMSQPEKIYLKNALQSPYAKLFLDESEIFSLFNKLSEIPDINFSEIIDFKGINPDPEFDEAYIKNFRLLIKAIRERKKISFINTDFEGKKRPNFDKIPVKIEYSVTQRYFWLSLWNDKEKRPFKANISRLSEIRLTKDISDEEYQTVLHMMEQKKEQTPIIMEITDKNNALERFCLLFSPYQKKIRYIAKNKAEISLYYYQFEEEEIINKIMSFGENITVLSPERVIEKIKKRLFFDAES